MSPLTEGVVVVARKKIKWITISEYLCLFWSIVSCPSGEFLIKFHPTTEVHKIDISLLKLQFKSVWKQLCYFREKKKKKNWKNLEIAPRRHSTHFHWFGLEDTVLFGPKCLFEKDASEVTKGQTQSPRQKQAFLQKERRKIWMFPTCVWSQLALDQRGDSAPQPNGDEFITLLQFYHD